MNLFVFGLGYTARHFVALYNSRFERVRGTVREPEKAATLRVDGIEARVFSPDTSDARIAADLEESHLLLVSIAPQDGHDPVLARVAPLLSRAKNLRWIGYLSTIGVYGDHGGAWVDETTPPNRPDARSRARLAAEAAWLDLGRTLGCPAQVFRLGGIYGPGRNALRQLAAGTARRIVKPGQVFNRIHVDDIARVLAASMEKPRAGAIYNVVDGAPSPAEKAVAYAADLLGIAPPPEIAFADAELSPMAASFYAENRRVRNALMRDELGVVPRYPSYREGLRALRDLGEGAPSEVMPRAGARSGRSG